MTLSTRFEMAVRMASKGACRECGETAAPALTRDGCCYECQLRRAGRSASEEHHVLGRSCPLTVEIPANIHRQISARTECRPAVLKRPSADPLVEGARIATIIAELIETGADYVRRHSLPDWLAALADIAAALCRRLAHNLLLSAARLDPGWHEGMEFLSWV